jgi:hypothetical protein
MQTLAAEITLTFVDDLTTFVTGCGRMIARPLMAPIERLARACDVAGVLSKRGSLFNGSSATSSRMASRRCGFSFRFLNHLT